MARQTKAITVKSPGAGQVARVVSMPVLPGEVVEVYPGAGNVGVIQVGLFSSEAAQRGSYAGSLSATTAGTQIECTDLSDIFIYFASGSPDSAIVKVRDQS
jgi:hypothetical protein